MKTLVPVLIAALASGSILVTPTEGLTQDRIVRTSSAQDGKKLVAGVVREISEKEITVRIGTTDTVVALTKDTIYMKGAKPAKAEDVKVGDQVKINAKAGDNGALQAVDVTILDGPQPL